MRMTIARRATSALTVLGQFMRRWPQDEILRVGASRTEVGRRDTARSDLRRPTAQEPVAAARGVIRREEVPLLPRYGTSYGLFDEWIADYECVLISDAYRLGEYVGDSVWVSGPLIGVIEGMPVMKVTHLQLLKMKWMHS